MADLSEDLPLMSNVEDMLVKHYNFHFKCNFEEKSFTCCALLFLEATDSSKERTCTCIDSTENASSRLSKTDHSYAISTENSAIKVRDTVFIFILDCHQIVVKEIASIHFNDIEMNHVKFNHFNPFSAECIELLPFSVCEWSLKIWTNGSSCKYCFPKFIRISYETVPSCPSLMWVKDQNEKLCVFNYGSFINNRALFPCQEPPTAMATWEATVSVSDDVMVIMSGDEEPVVYHNNGCSHYYYLTKKVLPLSTLCIAIGDWKDYVIPLDDGKMPKCRILACSKLLDKCIQEFSDYIPKCLSIARDVLGPYPFPRIDFLLVPSTFGSLGMASPNVVFLSQSLLSGDKSFCSRLSHEIAHGWFGLSIGALDWSEEWLSEGFATFLEDVLHAKVTSVHNELCQDIVELKEFIRKKTLEQEVGNTTGELQILRPSQGKTNTNIVDELNATVLKNGQNPMKSFTQVHYIKGYFLLKFLSNIVGKDSFLSFLKFYVEKFEGQLVASKEFLHFFLQYFPNERNSLCIENITENWLHNSGMNEEIANMKPSVDNKLFITLIDETQKWRKLNKVFLQRSRKRRKYDLKGFEKLCSEQMILLLENLLEEEEIHARTLKCLNDMFNFTATNAEVQHRWFELVVKHKYRCKYAELEEFLINHIAMGVYLYGELIYSGDDTQKFLAQNCFGKMKEQMEPNFRKTIGDMFDC